MVASTPGVPSYGATSSTSSPAATPGQYHHFIPRFILRRYQFGQRKSKEQRRRVFLRTGVDPEFVYYYDLATGGLVPRAIGNVYGVRDLYRDIRNIEDVNELERKLSRLESQAATVITDIHKSLAPGEFSLKRKALEQLRKFLFLMHYRACSSTYFQEDHPENVGVREWVAHTRRKHGLHSAGEVWLDVLRYYLDTPHSQIMLHADEMKRKYGERGVTEMCNGRVNPEAEHYPSLAYFNQAATYFLCIWEAADGEEFVLSSNGFGLWEGLEAGSTGLHRIFVVSPRVAIVLRSWVMRPEILPSTHRFLASGLLDIHQEPPTPTYADGSHVVHGNLQGIHQYRASKAAEEDMFAFRITKLTKLHTFAINSVILRNVPETGAVTCHSLDHMLRTTRMFCDSPMSNLNGHKFHPLLQHLSNPRPGSSVHRQAKDQGGPPEIRYRHQDNSPLLPPMFIDEQEETDVGEGEDEDAETLTPHPGPSHATNAHSYLSEIFRIALCIIALLPLLLGFVLIVGMLIFI